MRDGGRGRDGGRDTEGETERSGVCRKRKREVVRGSEKQSEMGENDREGGEGER